MIIPGFPIPVIPAGTGISYEWTAYVSGTLNLSSYPAYDTGIGTAGANRTVVVIVRFAAFGSRSVTSVTIGGTEATLYQNVSGLLSGAIAVLDVATGETADITVTLDDKALRCSIDVYALYDLSSNIPVDSDSSPTGGTGSASVTLDGNASTPCIFVAGFINNDDLQTTWTSPMVEDSDNFVEGKTYVSAASVKTTSASVTVTAGTSDPSGNGSLLAASFK